MQFDHFQSWKVMDLVIRKHGAGVTFGKNLVC